MTSSMKRFLCFAALAMVIMASSACKSKLPVTPDAPESYARLLEKYKAEMGYIALAQSGSATEIIFYDETTLRITDMAVDDCTKKNPKVVATSAKGEWMVGGEPTGIYRSENSLLSKAYPIYTYFTSTELIVKLDNGNAFRLLKVAPKSAVLPTIKITTKGGAQIVSKDNYVEGTIEIDNPEHMYSDQDGFKATASFKGRGNSTWGMPKKPYRIKLAEKSEMLGMNASKNWALLADYADKTLLRNVVAMELSRMCEFPWTPSMRKVEVQLNGKYIGVYTLAEHKEVSKNKVNINTDKGDIYFEIEQNQDEPRCWWTDHGIPMMFSDPSEPSDEVFRQEVQFFKDFEEALWNKEFQKVYDKYIDRKTFIDNYIVQELTKNIDGNLRKSTFLTKKKGEKLVMYHLWDFDLTMGNADYYDDGNKGPTGWWIKDRSYAGKNHGWYYRLFMDPEFVKAVKARWNELYPHFQTIPQFIEENALMLNDAQARNFKIWSITDMDWWNRSHKVQSYQGEIEYFIDFYNRRLDWLNTNINNL